MIDRNGALVSRPMSTPGLADRLWAVAASHYADLPALPDPRAGYPRFAAIVSCLALPIVLATASGRVVAGFGFRDVILLSILLIVAAIGAMRVDWKRLDERWLFAFVAAQVMFVASLNTMTGGGSSPYFVLYAPVLALAGWYLRGDLVSAGIVLVALTEVWRAGAIDRTGDIDQLTIALPFFAGLAVLSWVTSRRLASMLVTGRMDQVTTAAVLQGLTLIGAAETDDPMRQLVSESERIFGARAGLVTFQDREVLHVPAAIPLTGGAGYLRVPVDGARGSRGLLQLWRDQPFSNNDARLAWILARGAAMAADARSSHRAELGDNT